MALVYRCQIFIYTDIQTFDNGFQTTFMQQDQKSPTWLINECNIIEPAFIALRHEQIDTQSEYKSHSHPFGQLLYVVCGIMEMEVEGKHYLAPPEFCV